MADIVFEKKYGYPAKIVAGVDEVGRGCLAGPVVAAAVILPADLKISKHPWLREVTDSKLLSPQKREDLAVRIQAWAQDWSAGVATVQEIDRINIFHASHVAMIRAIMNLNIKVEHVLIDGKFLPRELTYPATAIIKGDQRCLSVACASIVAKVYRDQEMTRLSQKFPGYLLEKHKGYSTPEHLAALKQLGPSEIHRRSFAPVRVAEAKQ